ncbi:(d)CMP kinase [Microbulbifer harenosus]|uniref:Cytidylate kinase n=1 Tax=Microbulbifer harenosus TaxID=2576840 RepID=A0ABY2UI94_9GAMM|nr:MULTISPECIES: (d)CMP kinase [Microbulbifer]QIL88941.1 (d)CMP kinase [Microbulbifer sp. SH-1]TLM77676.1 (d)CMP kinase [Microbulbifer harenosus]
MTEATTKAPVITIDGPSGSGKGTIAKLLADKLGFALLDSGALYRLTALAALNAEVDLEDAGRLAEIASNLDIQFAVANNEVSALLEGRDVSRDIRMERVSMAASKVAAVPAVRDALLQRQRDFRAPPGLVADGRDMGTTVFPDAPVKIFLTASAEERARRRFDQLQGRGVSVSLRDLLEDIRARDDRDMNRAASPLAPAEDALVLDSTSIDIDGVLQKVLELVKQRIR